jgi:hypothetical protein
VYKKNELTILFVEAQVLEVMVGGWVGGCARAGNCQSLPKHVEELPTGTVAPACVPGRQDATFKHQPQPEAAIQVEFDMNDLQAESDPTATTDIEPTKPDICCMVLGLVTMVFTLESSDTDDAETSISIITEPERTFTIRTSPAPVFKRAWMIR